MDDVTALNARSSGTESLVQVVELNAEGNVDG